MVFEPKTGQWIELRQVRKKEKTVTRRDSNGELTDYNSVPEFGQLSPKSSAAIIHTQIQESDGGRRRNNPHQPQVSLPGKKRRLLRRSHHTICTIKGKTEKLRNGYKMEYYTSYVFGGLIQEEDGRLLPTNDLIEVVSKNVILDKSQADVGNHVKPSLVSTNADEATVMIVKEHGGIKPLPRRDH